MHKIEPGSQKSVEAQLLRKGKEVSRKCPQSKTEGYFS